MRFVRLFAVLIPLFGIQAADTSLQAVFGRMDAAAAKFRGLRADMRHLTHTDIMQDDDVETGTIAVRRTNKDLHMLVNFNAPKQRKVTLLSDKAEVYYPKMNTVQVVSFGKAGKFKDQLLTLGFGSTSKELQGPYDVQLGGPDNVAGQSATRIVLIPKNKELLTMFPKIELWISDQTGITIQQKLNQPGKDYLLATYTNVQLANVSEAEVKLDVPKDAKRENLK